MKPRRDAEPIVPIGPARSRPATRVTPHERPLPQRVVRADTSGMTGDARDQVEEPVRGALVGVMGRGIALVAFMSILALFPVVGRLQPEVSAGLAVIAIAILVGYGIEVRILQAVHGRPSEEARHTAWDRAKEIDSDDATLSLLVAGWVPAALLLALGLLLWPHLTDPNPAISAAWVVLGIPPTACAWIFATTSWLDACRDDLARAEAESDTRLRRYWANVRH
jgi:hypothetical protein